MISFFFICRFFFCNFLYESKNLKISFLEKLRPSHIASPGSDCRHLVEDGVSVHDDGGSPGDWDHSASLVSSVQTELPASGVLGVEDAGHVPDPGV